MSEREREREREGGREAVGMLIKNYMRVQRAHIKKRWQQLKVNALDDTRDAGLGVVDGRWSLRSHLCLLSVDLSCSDISTCVGEIKKFRDNQRGRKCSS